MTNFKMNIIAQSIVTRVITKTPFMAVMYGGSWKAIAAGGTSAGFVQWCNENNLDVEDTAKKAHAAVDEAMGSDFRNFISSVEHTVRTYLLAKGRDNLTYTHTDGFKVNTDNTSATESVESFSFVMSDAMYDEEGNELIASKVVEFGAMGSEDGFEFDTQKQMSETVRKFMVNYIQGLDALIARTVAAFAAKAGIRNYTSIHDCFRCHPADVALLQSTIADAYKHLFIDQDQLSHLEAQIGKIEGFENEEGTWVSYTRKPNFLTVEMLYSPNAYYFGK